MNVTNKCPKRIATYSYKCKIHNMQYKHFKKTIAMPGLEYEYIHDLQNLKLCYTATKSAWK